MYSSPEVDYANTGDSQLSFNTGGVSLTPGGSYVAFLSISQYYGDSSGEVQISQGTATIPGGNFVYYNNGGDFGALFNSSWDATALKPDWAVTMDFTSGSVTPEPSSAAIAALGAVAFLAYGRSRHRRNQRRQAAA